MNRKINLAVWKHDSDTGLPAPVSLERTSEEPGLSRRKLFPRVDAVRCLFLLLSA